MPLYKWSTTAASNATADPSINWAEGQAPSSVNDSARAMMAAIAVARQDWHATNGGGGTASAMTFTSQQAFSSLALLDGQLITFVCPITNGAGATMNVDGLGSYPICIDSVGTPVPAGVMVQGTPYMLTYYNSVSQWRLWNFFANPYNIPIGGSLDYWGTTAPNSNFAFMFGQAISRSTYATLFSLFSTTYGVGDGSTTFNIPDLRGRVTAGKDDMGGSASGRIDSSMVSPNATTLGASGGSGAVTLTTSQIPAGIPVSVSGAVSVTSTIGTILQSGGPADNFGSIAGSGQWDNITRVSVTSTGSNSMTGTASGSGSSHLNVQPTIICNRILRLI